MNYMLDTCVLSELGKQRPNPGVLDWMATQNPQSLYISVVTVAELEAGQVKLRVKDGARADKLAAWMEAIAARFADNTLATDAAVWSIWSQQCGLADSQGKSIAPLDGLLIATAQRHGLTVVTRNAPDFVAYPQVFNPWTAVA